MKAIDVSCWQKGIDYKAVKAAGVTAVIIRAGYGREVSQKDTQFETHYRNAKAAGLKVGAYWYSYADSAADAEKEAKACLSCISGKIFELPVYYDMEESWQTALGRSAITNMTVRFCDTLEAAGYRAGVYSNVNWFRNFMNYSALASKYSIWLAQWGTSTYSYDCDIWQYSENGSIAGISGNVDMNIIVAPSVISGTSPATSKKITQTATLKLRYLASTGYENDPAQVKTLQRLLKALDFPGADHMPLAIDGIFGKNTDYAVRAFQKANALEVDGIVGSATWKKLLGAK